LRAYGILLARLSPRFFVILYNPAVCTLSSWMPGQRIFCSHKTSMVVKLCPAKGYQHSKFSTLC
ncbi:MAG: hypothetical protein E7F26_10100, partial [Proteus mirabilis]|nr:hypothetical protein [Proteus mirabilis]